MTALESAIVSALDAGPSRLYRPALILAGGAPADVETAARAVVAVTHHEHDTFDSCELCEPLFAARRRLLAVDVTPPVEQFDRLSA